MANYKLHGRMNFDGISISVENRSGSVRSGIDQDGHSWSTRMDGVHYGRITGVPRKGGDEEHVDVFIKSGSLENTDKAFIVHLMKADDPSSFDEDKCFLNFRNAQEVRKCFDRHYDKAGKKLWGGYKEMSLDDFKKKLRVPGKGMIKSNVLHLIDLAKGYVEGYVRHDKTGKAVPVHAYENAKVGASAASLCDNSELCQGMSLGKLMARVEMCKGCRGDLRNILTHLVEEYGDQGVSVFEDWVNPAKVGARLFSKAMAGGVKRVEIWANLKPAIETYEKDFNQVLIEEGFKRSFGGVGKTFHVIDMDLIKAHVKAHFRKDPKTGKLIYVHDYDDSKKKHPDHEHFTFDKGEKVEVNGEKGTVVGYDENKNVLRLKLDSGKAVSITPHKVKKLEDKKEEEPDKKPEPQAKPEPEKKPEKTFDEKVKDSGVDVESILNDKEPNVDDNIGASALVHTSKALGLSDDLKSLSDLSEKWESWIKSVEGKKTFSEEFLANHLDDESPVNHLQAYAEALYATKHTEALSHIYGILKAKAEEAKGGLIGEPEKEPEQTPEPKKESKPKKPPKTKKEPEPEPEYQIMTDDDFYQQALKDYDPEKSLSKPMPKTKDNPDGVGVLNIGMIDMTKNPKEAHFGMKTKDDEDYPITSYENIKKFNKIGATGTGANDEISYQDDKIKKYVDMVKDKSDEEIMKTIDESNNAYDLFHIYKAAQNAKLEVSNFPIAWYALAKLDHLAKVKMASYLEEEKAKNAALAEAEAKNKAELDEALKNVSAENVFDKLNATGKTRGHMQQMSKGEAMGVIKKDLEVAGYTCDTNLADKIYRAISKFTDGHYRDQRHSYYKEYSNWSPYKNQTYSKEFVEEMELAEEYLSLAPPYPDPKKTTIYRGMHGTRKIFDALNVGDAYQLGAPTSLTTQKSTALSFDGDTMFIIHGGVPKAPSVRFISPHSEGENMGCASTVFKIIKKENDPLNPSRILVHMAVVVDNPKHHKDGFKHLKKKGA